MIRSIEDLSLGHKRVLMRVDFNVPLNAQGQITDDSRIKASLPSIQYALEKGAKLILASHLGRPKGKVDSRYSLLPVAERLAELLDKTVLFPEDCIGNAARKLVSDLREGEVILLENLRFHPEEEANDPVFSEKLAAYAEVYVDDSFGTIHRAHASTVGAALRVAERGAGLLVLKELSMLRGLVEEPERPFLAILGGAKVSDKLGVLESLVKKANAILIGGAMAYTFLRALGVKVGSSLVEENKIHQAEKILEKAKSKEVPIYLPLDHVVAQRLEKNTVYEVTSQVDISLGWMGVDIGPKTLQLFSEQIAKAKTILWNGPVGAFEIEPFEKGTMGIAHKIAESSAVSVVGGGDSLAAVHRAGVGDKISHLSTGGGASLEFIEGKVLPGLQVLEIH